MSYVKIFKKKLRQWINSLLRIQQIAQEVFDQNIPLTIKQGYFITLNDSYENRIFVLRNNVQLEAFQTLRPKTLKISLKLTNYPSF